MCGHTLTHHLLTLRDFVGETPRILQAALRAPIHEPRSCKRYLPYFSMPESGNVLVGIRVKKTVKVDLKGPIMTYMKRVYGDHIANEAADSVDVVQDLRNQIVGAGTISWHKGRCMCQCRNRATQCAQSPISHTNVGVLCRNFNVHVR
jgi:hypothetical protein